MYRILYIDDNQLNLDLIEEMLSPYFYVEKAIDSEEFFNALEFTQIDAVIIDINLSDTTGIKLFEKFSKNSYSKNCPAFFISSDNSTTNKINVFKVGADDFLDRMMSVEEIRMRILNKIEKSKQNEIEFISRLGPLNINQKTMTVIKNDQSIDLTSIEYKLLLALMKNPESFIKRDHLIEFIWQNQQAQVLPRTLNTHLSNLRKKIECEVIQIRSSRDMGVKICHYDRVKKD